MKTKFCSTYGAFLLTILLAGCVAAPAERLVEQMTPQEYAGKCTYTYDQYRKMHTAMGPLVEYGQYGTTYQLFAIWGERVVVYGMYVKTIRSFGQGWAFWEECLDADGNKLPTRKLNSDVFGGGGTIERVAVDFRRDYLDKLAQRQVSFRMDGQRARLEFSVPSVEVKNFIDFADARRVQTAPNSQPAEVALEAASANK